jgi:hypothetical protein
MHAGNGQSTLISKGHCKVSINNRIEQSIFCYFSVAVVVVPFPLKTHLELSNLHLFLFDLPLPLSHFLHEAYDHPMGQRYVLHAASI